MMHDGRTAPPDRDGKGHRGYLFAAFLLVLGFLVSTPGAHCTPEGVFDFRLSGGYRLGGLRWNIADSDEDPNVLSELSWSKLQISEIDAEARLNMESFTVRADVGYGYVFGGSVRDSDYDSDDRTDEFSRSTSKAEGGYLFDALTGLGYRFDFQGSPFTLLPMIGIGFQRQAMRMTEGVQVVEDTFEVPSRTPPLGPIDGLNSSYTANWLNLWVGLDAQYRSKGRWSAGAAFSVHPSLYYAEADWNLRTAYAHPVSFVHKAFGWGFHGDLWLGIELSRRFLLEGRFVLERWFTGPGVDETFFSGGGSMESPLNEVVWNNGQISIGTVLRL